MGYITLSNLAHDGIIEFNTTACVHCRKVIIQETHYVGGRPVKITISLSDTGGRIEEVDEGYYCQFCKGEACVPCGLKALAGLETRICNAEDKIYQQLVLRS